MNRLGIWRTSALNGARDPSTKLLLLWDSRKILQLHRSLTRQIWYNRRTSLSKIRARRPLSPTTSILWTPLTTLLMHSGMSTHRVTWLSGRLSRLVIKSFVWRGNAIPIKSKTVLRVRIWHLVCSSSQSTISSLPFLWTYNSRRISTKFDLPRRLQRAIPRRPSSRHEPAPRLPRL